MKAKGVFFDLYGTLLIYGDMTAAWDDWLEAFHSYLVRSGLSMDLGTFSEKCDRFFEKDEPPVADDHLTIYERRIQALCEQIDVDLSKTELSIVAERTASAFQKQTPVDPETHSVLESLSQDYSLALISNFDHPPHVISLLRENGH
jgi:FMN phosphatase YigB (HAD superfamily)